MSFKYPWEAEIEAAQLECDNQDYPSFCPYDEQQIQADVERKKTEKAQEAVQRLRTERDRLRTELNQAKVEASKLRADLRKNKQKPKANHMWFPCMCPAAPQEEKEETTDIRVDTTEAFGGVMPSLLTTQLGRALELAPGLREARLDDLGRAVQVAQANASEELVKARHFEQEVIDRGSPHEIKTGNASRRPHSRSNNKRSTSKETCEKHTKEMTVAFVDEAYQSKANFQEEEGRMRSSNRRHKGLNFDDQEADLRRRGRHYRAGA